MDWCGGTVIVLLLIFVHLVNREKKNMGTNQGLNQTVDLKSCYYEDNNKNKVIDRP